MRIGLVTPGFSASEQDWCVPVLLDLVRKLAARGHDVTVVALRYPHHRRPYRVFGADVIPLGGGTTRGLPRLLFLATALLRLAILHRQRRFSVLHAVWAHEPGLLVSWIGRIASVPTVVSVFGGELVGLDDISYGGELQWSNRWACRRALANADRIVAGSAIQRQLIESHIGCDSVRLSMVPLGVDTELFRTGAEARAARTPLEGDPALVNVASLVPVKDHVTLLRAFDSITSDMPQAVLHLFGEGPLRAELERLAVSLGHVDSILFHGEVRREELPRIFALADVNIIASRSEHIPLVCLEALACGCPTVGTAVGVLPELENVVSLSPPGDADALARSVKALLDSPDDRDERIRLGQEVVERRFSLDHSVRCHERLYNDLRKRARHASPRR